MLVNTYSYLTKPCLIVLLLFLHLFMHGQEKVITLENCHEWADETYPLSKQRELIQEQGDMDLKAVSSDYLPTIDLVTQASYQSEVTQVPVDNLNVQPPNNDQYFTELQINQLIYGGGIKKVRAQLTRSSVESKRLALESKLYQLKPKINKLYFSLLLNSQKIKLYKERRSALTRKIKEVSSGIENGIFLSSADEIFKVKRLEIDQQLNRLKENRESLLAGLSDLTGRELTTTTVFEKPDIKLDKNLEMNRPEIAYLRSRSDDIAQQKALIAKERYPKISGFAISGYGNPGLNRLNDQFETYFRVGVQLKWNVFDWNNNKQKRRSLTIDKQKIRSEINTFKLKTSTELEEQLTQIEKYRKMIIDEKKVISHRKRILATAESQLRNGTITSSTYISELTNLYNAENKLEQHQIQLALAKANYNIIKNHQNEN